MVPREGAMISDAEHFYSGALDRIRRFMLVLGASATLVALAALGWKMAVGVLLGSVAAYVNFHWLKQVVAALADRVSRTGRAQAGLPVAVRFLLRYVLLALGAYAIFTSSPASLDGFLGGLFLAVAAILCEAGYEVYVALRHGF
jgi:small-conductance mechanosensitive channel